MSDRYWLLLEKSDDTRISKGIDGYQDKTGELYNYDSLVPNHKQLGSGDYVVLRKENDILGVGRVGHISQEADAKIHRRCPECRSTDIRERSTKSPQWKCGKCANEFETPSETIVEVQSFEAAIDDFSRLNYPPSVHDVKRCAAEGNGINSQLSILELDPTKIQTLLEGTAVSPSVRSTKSTKGGQGFGLSQPERDAVEKRAMDVTRKLYEDDGWKVIDKSGSNPFDFLATRGKEIRYIEVKGTTGEGASIILTHGEVKHVRANRNASALVVVAQITLSKSGSDYVGSGGVVTVHEDPWTLEDLMLEPTEYCYSLKTKSPNNKGGAASG
jgi:ribosomal protein L37AE/L43A